MLQPDFYERNNSINQITTQLSLPTLFFLVIILGAVEDGRWIGDAKERANGKSFRQYGIQAATSRGADVEENC